MAYNDFIEMPVWQKADEIIGSCFEVRSHLYSGKTVGYFSNEQINPIDIKCMKIVEELNRIIKGLGS